MNNIPELLQRKSKEEQMQDMMGGPRFGQLRKNIGLSSPDQSFGVMQDDQGASPNDQAKGIMDALQKGGQGMGIPQARNDMMFSQESPEAIQEYSDSVESQKETPSQEKKKEDKFDYEGMGDALSKIAGSGAAPKVAKMDQVGFGQGRDSMSDIRARILESLMSRG